MLKKLIVAIGERDGPEELMAAGHVMVSKARMLKEGADNFVARYQRAGIELLYLEQDVSAAAMLFEIIKDNRPSAPHIPQSLRLAGQN